MLIVEKNQENIDITEEDLPEHLDYAMEAILLEMELHAQLSGFEEDFACKALKCIDGGFPVMLPGTFH